jgi:hypothetical protein
MQDKVGDAAKSGVAGQLLKKRGEESHVLKLSPELS